MHLFIRKTFLLLLFVITIACIFPITIQTGFDQKVATQVSLAQTSTAISVFIPTATIIGLPPNNTSTNSSTSSTVTPPIDDPKSKLGAPSWKDNLNNGNNFDLRSGITNIDENTTIKIENGAIVMSRSVSGGGKTWWLAYLKPKDFYLEGRFLTQTCNGEDQYGLVFRAVNYKDGLGYYFIATCDGHFNILRWDGSGASLLLNGEKTESLHSGSNQVNDLGVWAQGNLIRLYINGKLIKEINNSALTNSGHFGLFMDARETAGMSIKLDEIAYWNLP